MSDTQEIQYVREDNIFTGETIHRIQRGDVFAYIADYNWQRMKMDDPEVFRELAPAIIDDVLRFPAEL